MASCFFFSSITIFLLENEFLALFFLIIYLGAILILFLFVVMMLDLKLNTFKEKRVHSPVALALGLVLFFLTLYSVEFTKFFDSKLVEPKLKNDYINWLSLLENNSDVYVFANFFYANYPAQIIIAGVLLYISVVGVVFLTSTNKKSRQNSYVLTRQLSRSGVL
jgi:NADH-quinone oxidoreductase subunit J